jgi:hypothetical protein
MTMKAPTPEEVRAERERIGWTPASAATAVCVTERAWRLWEANKRKMPPGLWRLFTAMTGRSTVMYQTTDGRRAVLKLHFETIS